MRFSEVSREGDTAHASAVHRLDLARDDCQRLAEDYASVKETPGEVAALDRLAAGRAQVAAREAWLVWVERGV
jgi:hypothetical protein